MKGLTFLNDPWKLRTDQVFTLICMWKQDPWMRKCMDMNIVKKIAEYIKIDLSGKFKLTGGYLTYFFNEDFNSNYVWFVSDKKNNTFYYFCCETCLRPFINYCQHKQRNDIKDISSYQNRFKFDNVIIKI